MVQISVGLRTKIGFYYELIRIGNNRQAVCNFRILTPGYEAPKQEDKQRTYLNHGSRIKARSRYFNYRAIHWFAGSENSFGGDKRSLFCGGRVKDSKSVPEWLKKKACTGPLGTNRGKTALKNLDMSKEDPPHETRNYGQRIYREFAALRKD